MTQLIASYELAIGCECTAPLSLLPGSAGFFLPGEKHETHQVCEDIFAALIIAFIACSAALYVVV